MFMSSNYMYLSFFVPCCDISYDCHLLSPFFGSSLTPFILQKVDILFMLFVCIYVYWCPTRFLYQMMFVSFNSNTTGVTCRAGTSNYSGSPAFTTSFQQDSCNSIFSFLCSGYRSLFCPFIFGDVLSVHLPCTDSDYPLTYLQNIFFLTDIITFIYKMQVYMEYISESEIK